MRRYLPKSIAAADTGTIALFALLFGAAAFRLFLAVDLPIWLRHTRVEEDGLFLRLAASLVSGHWLGPYDQLTLMRGPGYPAFLGLSSLSGLPISVTHALFQITAVAVAAWAVHRLTASRAVAAVTFLVLVLDPIGFLPEVKRIIAEQIYWGQVLLVFSLAAVLLYAPPRDRAKAMALGGLLGLVLAWTWVTRADGAWLLPGLVLLAAGAGLMHRRHRAELNALARDVARAGAAFLAVIALVMGANRIAYGTFAVFDSKEPNFTAALDALEDVEAGPVVAYVPVPAAARAKVAEVSAAFRPIEASLRDKALLLAWGDPGCKIYPKTCGDYAGGWLVWALRDAAGRNALFKSPHSAAQAFATIANDVEAACADGRLTCRRRWPRNMPTVTEEQWQSLPSAMEAVGRKVVLLSIGDAKAVPPTLEHFGPRDFERDLALLNHPFVSRSGKQGLQTTLYGWYYDIQSARWPGFAVFDQGGNKVPITLSRRQSPDLQAYFKTDQPAWNRFALTYRCPDNCTIAALAFKHPPLRLPIAPERILSTSAHDATLKVDIVSYDWDASAKLRPAQKLAAGARSVLANIYGALGPLLLLAGLIALIAAVDGAIAARTLNPLPLIVAAAWLLVGTQIIGVALIDISEFPAATAQYAAPAAYLAVLATCLSFGAVVVQARQLNQGSGGSSECLRAAGTSKHAD